MSEEPEFELVRGSGNIFRDFDDPDADLKQAKAVLAASIIGALDERQLTVREASRLTGFAAADFSRIRNANLGRFTLDRLMRISSALDGPGVAVRIGDRLDAGRRPGVQGRSPLTIDYLKSFPIAAPELPHRLRTLLEPGSNAPRARVEVATRYDIDHHGPNREYVHMVMALAAEPNLCIADLISTSRDGVVAFSVPDVELQGELSTFNPSASGLDYIVASTGNGSFYSYNLAEKVWMTLGLSPRCLGGDAQQVVYDDLTVPLFGIVKGEISTEYHFSPKRNVRWLMSNEYLRRYLWMRGAHGIRIFFYEASLPDSSNLRSLMGGQDHVRLNPSGGWYVLDLREHQGRLLLQVWAVVVAIPPQLMSVESADGLVWPGVSGQMNRSRADALTDIKAVYLDDRFLERYEQNSAYNTVPTRDHGRWLCSPSYRNQWFFTNCWRVGRNLVCTDIRELYKPKPDREILHAHAFVLDPARLSEFDLDEEHIVAKTQRLVDELLHLDDGLTRLASALSLPTHNAPLFGLGRRELDADGWLNRPELCRLAQVSPINMTEQAFLARCKSLHELWQRLPCGFLRKLVVAAGAARSEIANFRSLKLLQALANILQQLNIDCEDVDAFGIGSQTCDIDARNPHLAALFANNDLRNSDAHNTGDTMKSLDAMDFDIAALNEGYGRALDHVFDNVIGAFAHINRELSTLLSR